MAAAGDDGSSSSVAAAGDVPVRCPPVIPFTISSAKRQSQYIQYIINGYEVSVNTRMPAGPAGPATGSAGPAARRQRVLPSTRGSRRSRKIRRKNKNQTRRK